MLASHGGDAMKFMIGTAALFLVLSSSPAFAQDEPKPQQQEEHKPQDSPKAPEAKAPPAKPDTAQPKEKPAPPPEKAAKPQTDEKQQQQDKKAQVKQTQDQQKQVQQQPKDQQAQAHNAPAAKNAGNGNAHRIPDDKFRANFGPQHHFRVARSGNRFQYGGYWFAYSDPWPTGWSYDDDCYIEDDGGVYYLIDALHPDLRLVVIVQVS